MNHGRTTTNLRREDPRMSLKPQGPAGHEPAEPLLTSSIPPDWSGWRDWWILAGSRGPIRWRNRGGGPLEDVEILLTSWGVPQLDAERWSACPTSGRCSTAPERCAASSRRRTVGPRHPVTNGADANAIPVAEFTFASIVLAGKKAHVLANDARTYRDDWSYIDGPRRAGQHRPCDGRGGVLPHRPPRGPLVQQLQDVTVPGQRSLRRSRSP